MREEINNKLPFVSLLLNWRETSSNPIVAELTMSESVTTRKAPSNKELFALLGDVVSSRNTDDIGISLGSIVRRILDDIPLS